MDHMAPCSVGVLPGPSYSPAPMPPDPPPLQVLLVAIDWALEPPWANSDSPVAAVSTYGPRADYHAAFAEALAPGSTRRFLGQTAPLGRLEMTMTCRLARFGVFQQKMGEFLSISFCGACKSKDEEM